MHNGDCQKIDSHNYRFRALTIGAVCLAGVILGMAFYPCKYKIGMSLVQAQVKMDKPKNGERHSKHYEDYS